MTMKRKIGRRLAELKTDASTETDRLEIHLDGELLHGPEPEAPVNPVVVNEGDDWMAVSPAERVITNQVHRREDVDSQMFDIINTVNPLVTDSDTYDLVEVDADPDAERQPKRSDR
jgi:hypothetical protein